MLNELLRVERLLPKLLWEESWYSLDIDYEPPRVERLWIPFEEKRIYLHRIYPCDQALYHPHPWPSAVLVVEGGYEMGVGYGTGTEAPPNAARMYLPAGSRYEMTDPHGWHFVRPWGGTSLSLMVTGKPWDRPSPGKGIPRKPLSEADTQALMTAFREKFPRRDL